MDLLEIETRIKHFETRLSESKCSEDMNWLECQLENLRFRMHLENLKRKAIKIKDEPREMELLNKYLHKYF